MRIETEIKLDFSDVLLKPKRSTLPSRKDVELERDFSFWKGIPIMASNMDGVGTFSMARALQEYNMLTMIKKQYSFREWKIAMRGGSFQCLSNIAVSTGTNVMWDNDAKDYKTMKLVLGEWPEIKFVCIDVAN